MPSFFSSRVRSTLLLCGVLGLTGFGLAACSESEKTAVEQRAAMMPMQADAFATLGYRVEWRGFANLLPEEKVEHFNIVGDALAVQGSKGVLTVLNAKSGAIRWSDQVATSLTRIFGSVPVGKAIVVSSEGQSFVYDAATGNLLAKHPFDHVVNTAPAVVGEDGGAVLVYGTYTGEVFGQLVGSGFRAWGSSTSTTIDYPPTPVGTDGTVAVCSNAGDVLILNGETGRGLGRANIYGGPGAGLSASDTTVFIASMDHSLYAFAKNGAKLWQHRTDEPLRHKPVYADYKVYADMGPRLNQEGGAHTGGMTAFDANTGKVLWSNRALSGQVVAIRKDKLLVQDGEKVWLADAAKGTIVETVTLKGVDWLVPEKFADGSMYAVSKAGVVAKLTPR